MYANIHTHTLTPQKGTHVAVQKRRHACFRRWPVQHGPAQDQIYKWWLGSDHILPGDVRYLLTMEGLWRCVKGRDQFRATHPTFSFLRVFLVRMVMIGKETGNLFWWATSCFLYVEYLFQQVSKECREFSGISRRCYLFTLFYILKHNKQNKRLLNLCPWISQICRKWQMLRCHS